MSATWNFLGVQISKKYSLKMLNFKLKTKSFWLVEFFFGEKEQARRNGSTLTHQSSVSIYIYNIIRGHRSILTYKKTG